MAAFPAGNECLQGGFLALLCFGRMMADGVAVVDVGVSIPNELSLDPCNDNGDVAYFIEFGYLPMRIRRFRPGHMAKLYFNYSTMNAGKSTVLLQASHNYRERGMDTYLMTARLDGRAGVGKIASRIGISADADTFGAEDNVFDMIKDRLAQGKVACVFVDEAQFLTRDQVWQLASAVDDLKVPVLAYGLRVDFQGHLFPGSAALLALADEMREVRTICECGRKATMVIRQDAHGNTITEGAQVQIGGNETYVSLCRRHWREAMGC